jgi:collagenase-like PrtC family protease
MFSMKKPELLCPVGGKDTLMAAILGGADAVYFGTRDFNARMNAKNFERNEVTEAVRLCHENGVRAYVTLNTLLTDRLLPRALETVEFLYTAGVDALIVADLGLARIIRENFPDFELHGSTQMSGHNTDAARFLKKEGFSRMVCARELDRDNLSYLCQNSPLEIELFVHGAICACHSGQCLMSSMIGDRSGNRGECAQPCRLPYNGAYPISFKDLSLARHVKEILNLGVSSLKIEGRMKGANYVYTVTRIWRTLLDEKRNATEKEMERLAGIFSRSGFTDGYFVKELNTKMLGVRTDFDKSRSGKSEVSFAPSGRKAPPIRILREEKKAIMPPLPEKKKSPFLNTARFVSPEQIPDTDFFAVRFLPLDRFDPKVANGVILPSVIFDLELEEVKKRLEAAVRAGAENVLVGNIGHFKITEGLDVSLYGDFRLNWTNSFSCLSYPNLEFAIPSPELNLPQLRDLRGDKAPIVYGRIPLMLLEKKVGAKALRDRRGVIFPVIGEGKRDVIVNSVPFYMGDRIKDLKEKGLTCRHFVFTTEKKGEILALIALWKEKKTPDFSVRRIK